MGGTDKFSIKITTFLFNSLALSKHIFLPVLIRVDHFKIMKKILVPGYWNLAAAKKKSSQLLMQQSFATHIYSESGA